MPASTPLHEAAKGECEPGVNEDDGTEGDESGDRLRDSGMFEPARLAGLVEEHRTHKREHSAILWSLLMFDGFLRNLD